MIFIISYLNSLDSFISSIDESEARGETVIGQDNIDDQPITTSAAVIDAGPQNNGTTEQLTNDLPVTNDSQVCDLNLPFWRH